MRNQISPLVLLAFATFAGCAEDATDVYQEDLRNKDGEPAYITIQHCLIGVRDGMPQQAIRSVEDGRELANELLERAKAGEDFAAIIRQYTDDSPPGIYKMANHGFESDSGGRIASRTIYARGGMVPAFGDIGFSLEVGQFGLAEYDPVKSQYGFHIIKRIR
ncbi:MAG TPA: hypothetical protein DDW52_29915 [Planctomycetaceae bacterium]|nr:hypothetical protein [Planctomycetaceae bacterium]